MAFPNPLPWYLPSVLPGPVVSTGPATFIAEDLVRVNLPVPGRIDAAYLATSSYSIALRSDSPKPGQGVAVVEVIPPTGDLVAFEYIYLRTTRHTLGAYYEVTISGQIVDTAGLGINLPPAAYAARVTKTMAMLKSLPSHFDMRNESLVRNLVTAISLQDDIIGGSRRDEFS